MSLGLWEVEVHRISRQLAHEGGKIVSPMHQLPLPARRYSCTYFCLELSQHQDHSLTRRIKLMKNPIDLIGNWTCILPACSAMPQPTVPPHTSACFNV